MTAVERRASEPMPEKALNRCTVEHGGDGRGYVRVTIEEYGADAEAVARACRDALLGLGFQAESIDPFIPDD